MPAREIFADTAGWANYFVRPQPFHSRAVNLLVDSKIGGLRVVTTNYVVAELASLSISPLHAPRSVMIDILRAIRAASWVEVVHIDRPLDEEAWALLQERADKDWSLVDCASIVLMRRRNITEARK